MGRGVITGLVEPGTAAGRRAAPASSPQPRRVCLQQRLGADMRYRVVVTGMGVVSPIGCTVAEFTASLRAGVSGVGPITLFDPASLRTRIAAEVKPAFVAFRDRKISFALDAARQAALAACACGSRPGGERGG